MTKLDGVRYFAALLMAITLIWLMAQGGCWGASAQPPTPTLTYKQLLDADHAQPDGYMVERIRLTGDPSQDEYWKWTYGSVWVVTDKARHVTCYVRGDYMVCLNTYEYGR